MKRICCLILVACVMGTASLAQCGDGEETMETVSRKLAPQMEQAGALYAKGEFEASRKLLFDVYPQATRTPLQTLMLANMIYSNDPALSYKMHKAAALAMPNDPTAQLEWGMEQQRAKEWAGADAAYAVFDQKVPSYAPVLGMRAQCLIEQGKVKEACEMWSQSERSSRGTLEQMESLVCEVNSVEHPLVERVRLFNKAKGGDIEAAQKLIVLDAGWPSTWWSNDVMSNHLEGDAAMLVGVKFADGDRAKELIAAAEIAMASSDSRQKVIEVCKAKGYLLDGGKTLPKDPGAMCVMLSAALLSEAVSREEAREAWGAKVLAAAKAEKNKDLLNVAANIYLKTEKLAEIDQYGWDELRDARFAASRLVGLMGQGKLTVNDPLLAKAIKEFPLDGMIVQMKVRLLKKENKLTEADLVAGIKAEFHKFSIGGMSGRPSSGMLRSYFKMLNDMAKGKAAPAAPAAKPGA